MSQSPNQLAKYFNLYWREESFKQWSLGKRRQFKRKIELFIRSGFYYNPLSNNTNNITCYYCSLNWDPTTDGSKVSEEEIHEEHKKRSPNCLLMTLERLDSRLASFSAWNETKFAPPISSKQLAKAGFFLNCIKQQDADVVTCFQCGVTLGNWERNDDAFEEHSKRNPLCHFLLYQSKGKVCFCEKYFRGLNPRIICEEPMPVEKEKTVGKKRKMGEVVVEEEKKEKKKSKQEKKSKVQLKEKELNSLSPELQPKQSPDNASVEPKTNESFGLSNQKEEIENSIINNESFTNVFESFSQDSVFKKKSSPACFHSPSKRDLSSSSTFLSRSIDAPNNFHEIQNSIDNELINLFVNPTEPTVRYRLFLFLICRDLLLINAGIKIGQLINNFK